MTTELPNIRDQLGILEASLVPDLDLPTDITDELANSVDSIVLDGPASDGANGGGSSALSRTTSASEGDAVGSAGPTSGNEDNGCTGSDGPEGELDLLRTLFPNLYVHVQWILERILGLLMASDQNHN